MNWTTHGGAAVLGVLLVNAIAYAEDPKPKSGWKELFQGPALPAELTKDVDVIRPRITNWGGPAFPPYHMRNLRAGVEWDMQPVGFARTWGSSWSFYDSKPVIHSFGGHHFVPGDQPQYAFTMHQADKPMWDCVCKWAPDELSKSSERAASPDVTTSREKRLHCDFAKPGGEAAWSLDADVEHSTYFVKDARLISSSREFQITPMTITLPRGLAALVQETHLPGGYVFSVGETAVAAVQIQAQPTHSYQPGIVQRIILHRSLDAADRSLLAAATVALLLNRFAEVPSP